MFRNISPTHVLADCTVMINAQSKENSSSDKREYIVIVSCSFNVIEKGYNINVFGSFQIPKLTVFFNFIGNQ